MSAGPGAAEGADQTPNGAKGDQTTETGRVPSLATQSSNTYRRPNGTYRTIAYGTPVNYQDEYGLWQPIDNRLVASSSAGYAAENAANSYDVKVPAQGSQAPFRFSVGHAWVQMRMHGLQAAPEVSGDTATFDSGTAASRVDYTAVATGLKEDIILDSAPGSAPRFVYDFHTSPGLTPGTAANGGIDFKTSDGDVPFQIPPGLMYDSATPAANSDNVTFDLTGSKNDWTLTVTPDNSWLQDAARTYPVTIDPSLVAQPVVRDCEIRSDSPDSHICGNGDLARLRARGTCVLGR